MQALVTSILLPFVFLFMVLFTDDTVLMHKQIKTDTTTAEIAERMHQRSAFDDQVVEEGVRNMTVRGLDPEEYSLKHAEGEEVGYVEISGHVQNNVSFLMPGAWDGTPVKSGRFAAMHQE